MRRRTWLLLALLGLGMAWGGLPRGREMGSMALIRTLGVDWEDGQYVVTASTGRRARGFQGEEAMEPLILSARRDTLSAALAAVAAGSEQEVYFGYVDQLLLGRELAKRGALPVLERFIGEEELGLGAQVWLICGQAKAAVTCGGEEGAEPRLTVLAKGEEGSAGFGRTVGAVLTDLNENGCAYVPALEQDQRGLLWEKGCGILAADGLRGWLFGAQAQGMKLLTGGGAGDVIELADGRAAEIAGVRTGLTWDEDSRTMVVRCRIALRLTEGGAGLAQEEREALLRQIEMLEEERIGGTLRTLSNWKSDCLGLGRRLRAEHPFRTGGKDVFSNSTLRGAVQAVWEPSG